MITHPEFDLRLLGGSDLWDTTAGVVLLDDYLASAGTAQQFSLGTATFGVAHPAQSFVHTLAVLSQGIVVAHGAMQFKQTLAVLSKSIAIQKNQLGLKQILKLLSASVLSNPQSIGMVMLYPPVLFEIARYVWGVQGAQINLGSTAVQGVVVPRAILQAWLWQNQQEVLAERGAVCILRSGTVIFVVG